MMGRLLEFVTDGDTKKKAFQDEAAMKIPLETGKFIVPTKNPKTV
jgi:formylmethanofuran:tetrahydromethanopterin formyltransferase